MENTHGKMVLSTMVILIMEISTEKENLLGVMVGNIKELGSTVK